MPIHDTNLIKIHRLSQNLRVYVLIKYNFRANANLYKSYNLSIKTMHT